MEIDRVLYPVESLGPGKRLVIWTVGCSKHCFNCANEELWARDDSRRISADELYTFIVSAIGSETVEGITFTGGDPLEQADETLELAEKLREYSDDILVFTGYTIEEVESLFSEQQMQKLKEYVSVLIEGRYIDALNDGKVPLRGSTNQRVIFFDESKRDKYEKYMDQGRKIQNIYAENRVVSVGIHNPDQVWE